MSGIAYPVAVKDLSKFKKQNDISVNVFGYEEGYYPKGGKPLLPHLRSQ